MHCARRKTPEATRVPSARSWADPRPSRSQPARRWPDTGPSRDRQVRAIFLLRRSGMRLARVRIFHLSDVPGTAHGLGEFSMSKSSDSSLTLSRPGPTVPARSVSQLVPVEPATKPSIRILVADDERTLRESCASVLGVEGYNVTVTGRGEEALDLLRRRPFDIVLLGR